MAELILKVGGHPSGLDKYYQDGDILCAFSRRRIRSVHAQHICSVSNFGFNSDWLRADSLAQRRLEIVSQYRFDRVSEAVGVRTDLATGDQAEFGPESWDLPLHIKLMCCHQLVEVEPGVFKYIFTRNKQHNVFGEPGAEYWFGGRTTESHTELDAVWACIESDTALREANHTRWPMSEVELRHYLPIGVDDFDVGLEDRLVAQERSIPGKEAVINYARRACVHWEDLGLGGHKNVLDRSVTVDHRDDVRVLADIVEYKPRKTVWDKSDRAGA